MSKVTTYSNWCEIDQLDGKDIVDGETLLVKWPDGTKEVYEARVKKWSVPMMEQGGHTWNTPHSQAFVLVRYRGKLVEIALAGLEATRGSKTINRKTGAKLFKKEKKS